MKKSTRRKFILSSATVSIGSMLATAPLSKLFASDFHSGNFDKIGFDQQPLSFAYSALEPAIDAMTMEIHYSKHAAGYCKNLKEASLAEQVDTKKTIENLLNNISKYSVKMRNNAGGHFNHELFWKCLTPKPDTQVSEKLSTAINSNFGSMESFKRQFADASKTRFGSGWAWLAVNSDHKLFICSTANQDNTLMDFSAQKGTPLFGLDVWEHAYYLHYQNRRADYIDSFWKILNWNFVSERFNNI